MIKNKSILDLDKERFYKLDVVNLREIPIERIKHFYDAAKWESKYKIDLSNVKSHILKKELIDFIFYCFNMEDTKPYTIHTTYILWLKNSLHILNNYETLKEIKLEDFDEISSNSSRHFLNLLFNYSKSVDVKDSFQLDIWNIKDLMLSKERLNPSRTVKTISFNGIANNSNKDNLKKYIQYTIGTMDLSIYSIIPILSAVKRFLIYIDKKDVEDVSRKDVVKFYEHLDNQKISDIFYNRIISMIQVFFEYLTIHHVVKNNYYYVQDMKKNEGYKFKESSVDNHVIKQIFNCLDKIDIKLTLIFLLIYCTGMRVSEACQVKKCHCLEKTNNVCFIRYYNQKMQKEVTNIIPDNLYDLILEYKSNIKNKKQEYLFLSQKGTAYQSSVFSSKFDKILSEFNVTNVDCSPYRFKAHDYRHLFASRMREQNIPYQFIMKQLHHESPEMTLAYIEYTDKVKIKKMNQFINTLGEDTPIKSDIKFEEDDLYAEWLRTFINTQMLTNGVCSKPVKLGKCSHANSCLTCTEFRTSEEFLFVHKKHLCKIEKFLDMAKDKNLKIQIESNRKIKEILINIISKLESEKGE